MNTIDVLVELKKFDKITFYEGNHTYRIDGAENKAPSVTKLISLFKKPFDVEGAAKGVASRTGLTVEEVKDDWTQNNLLATTLGSLVHKYIENFYSNKRISFDGAIGNLLEEHKQNILDRVPVLVQQFKQFHNDFDLLPVRTELVVGDINGVSKTCGMIDLLAYDTVSNTYNIVDFKTSKKISHSNNYKQKMLHVLSHLDECEMNTYAIQMNVYKFLIEKATNIVINKMQLVWLNVNNKSYQVIEAQDLQTEVETMFEWVIKHSSK